MRTSSLFKKTKKGTERSKKHSQEKGHEKSMIGIVWIRLLCVDWQTILVSSCAVRKEERDQIHGDEL